jgi:hypothetical protein
MNLIVSRSKNPSMLSAFEQMLDNSPLTDTHLLLGYGYLYYDEILAKIIARWMSKDFRRTVIFIVGIHGRHKLTDYEKGRMKRSDEPSLEESNKSQVVDALVRYAKDFSFSKPEDLIRIKTAAVYQFHAKICALMTLSEPKLGYDDLYEMVNVDPEGDGPFEPVELIMGSTNFSEAGMYENIELDMHVPRDAVTSQMTSQINNLLSVTAERLRVNGLSKKVTEEVEQRIVNQIYAK